MEVRPISLASDRRRAPVAAALIVILGVVAYSRLLWPGPGATDLADLLFRPGTVPPPLAVAVAAFVLWRRRARLRSLPGPGAPLPAVGLAVVGTGLFVWAGLTGDTRHLLPSLAANGLAVATAARGWAGWRAVLVPACILLLGTPLPKPLEDEIVWQLQRGTASAAGWLLNTIGHDVVRDGVILRGAEHTFHVIDGCSGLSGIAILSLIALDRARTLRRRGLARLDARRLGAPARLRSQRAARGLRRGESRPRGVGRHRAITRSRASPCS